ncbi:iron-siderophore ABC transporter substrate-binding protein [Consotaella aegiceratis]|uniref:iron-siderophore ABC transporter substrate-binding protein n=1 Tax=Consotaella aegiceratis TaxID=3097961 RepID=UPI002F42C653
MTHVARNPSRRRVLAMLSGAVLATARPALAAGRRVAVLDWALLETALALDLVPVAGPELRQFRRIAVEPDLPATIVDLGLRGSPNFELLASLAPDVIYGSNFSAWAHDLVAPIAPVRTLSIYLPGEPPYPKAEAVMRAMAEDTGIGRHAEPVIAGFARRIDERRRLLTSRAQRPVFLVSIGDPRHVRVFGDDAMFGDVLTRLGFTNAWGRQTSYSATAPVEIEALAKVPDAIICIIGPVPPDATRVLPQSALWRALPAVREGRVLTLDPIDPFGGLPAAQRFARLFAAALSDRPGGG